MKKTVPQYLYLQDLHGFLTLKKKTLYVIVALNTDHQKMKEQLNIMIQTKNKVARKKPNISFKDENANT